MIASVFPFLTCAFSALETLLPLASSAGPHSFDVVFSFSSTSKYLYISLPISPVHCVLFNLCVFGGFPAIILISSLIPL